MCLSNVYRVTGNGQELVFKNAATVSQNGEKLVFTDILGVPKAVEGRIEKIDLLENYILIREDGTNAATPAADAKKEMG